jgi:hypothetical protein
LRFTVFTRRAKDLRPIPRGDAQRRRQAIVGLERGAQADVRALKGRAPWLRMRVGDYRLLSFDGCTRRKFEISAGRVQASSSLAS